MMFAIRFTFFISFILLDICSKHSALSISVAVNETQVYKENDEPIDEESLSIEQKSELLERYRRLIPYMTYYVMNNYVNTQQQPQQPSYSQTESPILRRPATSSSQAPREYATLRPVQVIKKNRYQVSTNAQEERFIPSVQYNPKDVNPDADYFVPIRYEYKDGYEDYGMSLRMTTRPVPVTVTETRYQTTARPLNFLPQKLNVLAAPPTKLHQQEYTTYSQIAPEQFESVRYTQQRHQPLQYVQPPVGPRPTILEPVQPVPRVSLNHVLKSLQLTNQLPEVLNKDNIDSSIKTLVEILNILNMGKKENYAPVYDKIKPVYTKPKVITESNYEATQLSVTPHQELLEIKPPNLYVNQIKSVQIPPDEEKVVEIKPRPYINQYRTQVPPPLQTTVKPPPQHQKIVEYYVPIIQDVDEEKPVYNQENKESSVSQSTEESIGTTYNAPENHDEILEDEKYTLPVTTEEPTVKKLQSHAHAQTIPTSLKYGATRGKPHIDYPAYTEIPETDFSCKQQRYKGFFGDPQTGCQVWHYCDLNGGKSSFLCPNGTIFSQVALTCDWWFNVKCESTTQLYVLNERLYKYILPIIPKFPEDFTGPEVDKYLELKFKEMEAKLKEKKMKKEQEEKDKSALNTLQSIEDSK